MVCSCAMSSDCVYLQITFCSCVNETTRFSFLRSVLHENGRSLHFSQIFVKIQLGDRMVVNDYWTWLSQNIMIDLLATEKSWFSTQPCPVILLLIIHKNISTICTFCFFYFVFVLIGSVSSLYWYDVGFEAQILCATLMKFQLVAGVTHFVSVYCVSLFRLCL